MEVAFAIALKLDITGMTLINVMGCGALQSE